MTTRKLSLSALTLGLILLLAACTSSTATPKKLSGAEAKASLISILQTSAQEFQANGGSESITVDPAKMAVIYDPQAAEGRKTVTVDIDNPSKAAFAKDAPLTLPALTAALQTDAYKDATYSYADGIYKVVTPTTSIDIWTKDGRVTSVATTLTTSKATSIVVFGYGLTSGAKTFIDTATTNAAK